MKPKEKNTKIEFTRGSSITPLPGVRSADLNPKKEAEKKGTSKDLAEAERKRMGAENDAKRQKSREGNK